MILHDLLSTLKTSLYRCMLLSPGSCDMPVHDMARPTNSIGRKVREKIFSTCYALLNVGFMAILRKEHIYILIWACNPALLNSRTVIFQNCSSSKTKPTQNENVVLFCSHEHVLETMSVVLHGRPHPAKGSRVRGSQGPYGFKGTKIWGSQGLEG